jgi:hypothetical protein
MQVWMRVCAAGALLAALSAGAVAQENLEQGKSAAQLFASDCAACHKSPQELVKEGYPTEAFLRVHYTSSQEMAAALFTYLRGIARAEPASDGKRSKPKANVQRDGERKPKRKAAKPDSKSKGEGTSAKPESKPSENASGVKAEEAKTPEKKAEPDSKKE